MWDAAVAELIGELPPERALPLLRSQWDHQALRDAILPVLARKPEGQDRDRFIEGLGSLKPAVVDACLHALEQLPPLREPRQIADAIRALRGLSGGKEVAPLQARLDRYLRRVTGRATGGGSGKEWADWFAQAHPRQAALVLGEDGVDVTAWQRRLAGIDWQAGNADRGRDVFARAACTSCHSGTRALGPDLAGVASRFSRADLFTAILQPSLEVPPRYRLISVTTRSGMSYQGLIVYEAPDSVILQTGPDAVVRIPGDQVEERRTSTRSPMPAGLLDKLTDRDVADLYAFLKGLRPSPGWKLAARRSVPRATAGSSGSARRLIHGTYPYHLGVSSTQQAPLAPLRGRAGRSGLGQPA